MKKILITAEIRKYATVEKEITDDEYDALMTDGTICLDDVFEAADKQHNDVAYDYQIVDADTKQTLVDWD
jgi:hypothetical protein